MHISDQKHNSNQTADMKKRKLKPKERRKLDQEQNWGADSMAMMVIHVHGPSNDMYGMAEKG